MEFNKSSNPIFGKTMSSVSGKFAMSETMTLNGTINKTFILFITVLVAASLTWKLANPFNPELLQENYGMVTGLMIFGVIGGLIAALVTVFKKEWSAVTAPMYAVFEGLFLGGVSAFAEAMYPGLVMQAVMLTFGVFLLMLFAYRTGLIKPTEKFMMGVMVATGAIGIVYLVSMVMNMFGGEIPMIHSNGWVGIGFSLVVVAVAALNLILDFKFIEDATAQRMPKYMERYGAFGLMVTLIWLYIEILRLLMKLQSRD